VTTPLTAFVAGATGYTGQQVVAALRDRGVRTIAHVRPGSAAADAWRGRFEAIGAEVDQTPWTPAGMNATLGRVRPDFVFALLGTTRRRATADGLSEPYERIDYDLTAMLRDACLACGSAPRFVYLSAMGANERSANKYVAVRVRMERELREGPLPWLVARPAFVSGSDRAEFRLGERVLAVTSDALFGALALVGLGRVRDRYGSLTGRELGTGLVALALAERDGRVVADVARLRLAARSPR
jgi:uncharacterized protein YbjT (DUF2867 family)